MGCNAETNLLSGMADRTGANGMKPKHSYQPPYTITSAILNLVAGISEAFGRFTVLEDMATSLRLRRVNRIRTIRGSLAIEGNTMSEEQITAIMDGRRVIAPPREIQEVRNAIAAYDRFTQWRPENEANLLEAHRILMAGLIDEIGVYRDGGVGVLADNQVIHMAPSAVRVPELMGDLFRWLADTDAHPLITGSVFHYEFEFIHPFADGNGRMGRLWQTLILTQWNPLFADIPVESMVHEHQAAYYQALQDSTSRTDSAAFIEFMLRMILDAVTTAAPQVAPQVTPQVSRLLVHIRGEMSSEALQNALELQDRKSFRERYLKPAMTDGWIEMTIPDKPNSRLQKYRLTNKGRQWLHQREG